MCNAGSSIRLPLQGTEEVSLPTDSVLGGVTSCYFMVWTLAVRSKVAGMREYNAQLWEVGSRLWDRG